MRDSSKKKAHASVNSMSEGATDAYRKGCSGMTEQLGHLNAKVAKEGLEPCDGKLSCPVVCPAKAGMFSGSKSHRGKSQKPRSLGHIRGGNESGEADRQSRLRDGERVTGP